MSTLLADGALGRSSSSSKRSRNGQRQQHRRSWLQWASAPAVYAATLIRRLPGGSWVVGSGKQQPENSLRRRGSDLFDRPSGNQDDWHSCTPSCTVAAICWHPRAQSACRCSNKQHSCLLVPCRSHPVHCSMLHGEAHALVCGRLAGVRGQPPARLCGGDAPELRARRHCGV